MKRGILIGSIVAAVACATVVLARTNYKASKADKAGVKAAILDYVEGVYLVDPSRIERSVHPDLAKVGYGRREDGSFKTYPMTYDQLRNLAATYNKDGRIDPKKAPKRIVVFEVLDKTASAKLTAEWGIDYFHLAKHDGKWKIMNVLWQSAPPR